MKQYKITLNDNWNTKIDLLNNHSENLRIKVISDIKIKYNKWYWKLLNKLTFGMYFNIEYSYRGKILNKYEKS